MIDERHDVSIVNPLGFTEKTIPIRPLSLSRNLPLKSCRSGGDFYLCLPQDSLLLYVQGGPQTNASALMPMRANSVSFATLSTLAHAAQVSHFMNWT